MTAGAPPPMPGDSVAPAPGVGAPAEEGPVTFWEQTRARLARVPAASANVVADARSMVSLSATVAYLERLAPWTAFGGRRRRAVWLGAIPVATFAVTAADKVRILGRRVLFAVRGLRRPPRWISPIILVVLAVVLALSSSVALGRYYY